MVMGLTHRLQVLIDPATGRALRRLAGEQGRSVGDLVREAVRERYGLAEPAQDAKQALAEMRGAHDGIPLPAPADWSGSYERLRAEDDR